MKIYTFATGEYKALAQQCLADRIKENIEVVAVGSDVDLTLPGQTSNLTYLNLMVERVIFNRKVVEENQGSKVLFLDCDIMILDYFVEDLSKILDTCDFAFQSKTGEIDGFNGGIQAVNCNPRSLDFFNRLVDSMTLGTLDTSDIEGHWRSLLEEMKSAGSLVTLGLPPSYGFLNPQTKMYHAICGGTTIAEKTAILSLVYQVYTQPSFHKLHKLLITDYPYSQLVSHGLIAHKGFPPGENLVTLMRSMIERRHSMPTPTPTKAWNQIPRGKYFIYYNHKDLVPKSNPQARYPYQGWHDVKEVIEQLPSGEIMEEAFPIEAMVCNEEIGKVVAGQEKHLEAVSFLINLEVRGSTDPSNHRQLHYDLRSNTVYVPPGA